MKAFTARIGEAIGGLAGDDGGATLVEFALVAPMFLLLLLGAIELGVLGMVSADFNNAVQLASRQVRTGQADRPTTAPQYIAVICGHMVDGASDCQSRIRVSVQPVKAETFAAAADQLSQQEKSGNPVGPGNNQAFDAGQSGDVMLVTATFRWPLIVPFAEGAFKRVNATDVLITSRLVFRNEPYAA